MTAAFPIYVTVLFPLYKWGQVLTFGQAAESAGWDLYVCIHPNLTSMSPGYLCEMTSPR